MEKLIDFGESSLKKFIFRRGDGVEIVSMKMGKIKTKRGEMEVGFFSFLFQVLAVKCDSILVMGRHKYYSFESGYLFVFFLNQILYYDIHSPRLKTREVKALKIKIMQLDR